MRLIKFRYVGTYDWPCLDYLIDSSLDAHDVKKEMEAEKKGASISDA